MTKTAKYTLYTMVHKKCGTVLWPISLSVIDQFSKFFHRHTLQTICNNVVTGTP